MPGLLAERDVERRMAHDLDQPCVRLADVRVDRRREERAGYDHAGGSTRLALHDPYLRAVVGGLDDRELVAVRVA